MSYGQQIGSLIRETRLRAGLTQEQLAGRELSKGFISLLEAGKTHASLRSLTFISERLGIPLNDLLGREADPEEVLGHLMAQVEMYVTAGSVDQARKSLKMAEPYADATTETRWQALISKYQGTCLFIERDYESSLGFLETALSRLSQGERRHRAEILLHIGAAHFELGAHYKALEHFRKSYSEIKSLQEPEEPGEAVVVKTLCLKIVSNLANVANQLGRVREAAGFYGEALEVAETISDPRRLASLYMGLSLVCSKKGDFMGAVEYAHRARDLFGSMDNLKMVASVCNNLGMAHAAEGDWDNALTHLKRGLTLFEQLGDQIGSAYVMTELAKYHRIKGEFEVGLQLCQRVHEIAMAHGDKTEEARILRVEGTIHAARGNSQNAVFTLRRSASIFESIGIEDELAATQSELGKILLQTNPHEAAQLLLAANEHFRKNRGLIV